MKLIAFCRGLKLAYFHPAIQVQSGSRLRLRPIFNPNLNEYDEIVETGIQGFFRGFRHMVQTKQKHVLGLVWSTLLPQTGAATLTYHRREKASISDCHFTSTTAVAAEYSPGRKKIAFQLVPNQARALPRVTYRAECLQILWSESSTARETFLKQT